MGEGKISRDTALHEMPEEEIEPETKEVGGVLSALRGAVVEKGLDDQEKHGEYLAFMETLARQLDENIAAGIKPASIAVGLRTVSKWLTEVGITKYEDLPATIDRALANLKGYSDSLTICLHKGIKNEEAIGMHLSYSLAKLIAARSLSEKEGPGLMMGVELLDEMAEGAYPEVNTKFFIGVQKA